jgi:hypothetical protein
MLDYAFNLTFSLDDRFGQPHKRTLSQRDVPGITRAALPRLAANGVGAITVGVNGGSTPPNVPRAFLWRDPVSNVSLPAMWHPRGYGGISFEDAVILPGGSHAIVFDWEVRYTAFLCGLHALNALLARSHRFSRATMRAHQASIRLSLTLRHLQKPFLALRLYRAPLMSFSPSLSKPSPYFL